MALIPYMISFILCNGVHTAMGSSKEQGISTNNCKDKGSTTLTTVKTKDHQQCKDQGLTTLTTVKTKDHQQCKRQRLNNINNCKDQGSSTM